MKSKKDGRYKLTFLGLLNCKMDTKQAKDLSDYIELYMRRIGHNAIILDEESEFNFYSVVKKYSKHCKNIQS